MSDRERILRLVAALRDAIDLVEYLRPEHFDSPDHERAHDARVAELRAVLALVPR